MAFGILEWDRGAKNVGTLRMRKSKINKLVLSCSIFWCNKLIKSVDKSLNNVFGSIVSRPWHHAYTASDALVT